MSMIPLLACALALQVPVDEPPRLRTILDNGAAVLVEPMSKQASVVVDLWISSASSPETAVRNGARHLLEHFLARGPKRDIDQRLESAGGFLSAQTYRDAMRFEVTVPRSSLALGLQILREVLTLSEVTQDEIDREAKILAQEDAIRDPSARLSAAAWDAAYGGQAPDPFGNRDVIAGITPTMLTSVHRTMLRGDGMAVVIVGDIGLDYGTKLAKETFGNLPKGDPVANDRKRGHGGVGEADCTGSARGAIVDGFREPSTAAALMAGLALASEIDDSFFIYTPSDRPGLMVVGERQGNGVAQTIATADPKALYASGKALAKRWVQSYLSTPDGIAYLRGLLLCQGNALRPETLLDNVEVVTYPQFADAFESYRDARAVKVVGR